MQSTYIRHVRTKSPWDILPKISGMIIFEKPDIDSLRVNEVVDKFLVAMSRKHHCPPPGTKSHGTFSHKKEIFQSESEVLVLKENNALEMFESERRRDSFL